VKFLYGLAIGASIGLLASAQMFQWGLELGRKDCEMSMPKPPM